MVEKLESWEKVGSLEKKLQIYVYMKVFDVMRCDGKLGIGELNTASTTRTTFAKVKGKGMKGARRSLLLETSGK